MRRTSFCPVQIFPIRIYLPPFRETEPPSGRLHQNLPNQHPIVRAPTPRSRCFCPLIVSSGLGVREFARLRRSPREERRWCNGALSCTAAQPELAPLAGLVGQAQYRPLVRRRGSRLSVRHSDNLTFGGPPSMWPPFSCFHSPRSPSFCAALAFGIGRKNALEGAASQAQYRHRGKTPPEGSCASMLSD